MEEYACKMHIILRLIITNEYRVTKLNKKKFGNYANLHRSNRKNSASRNTWIIAISVIKPIVFQILPQLNLSH